MLHFGSPIHFIIISFSPLLEILLMCGAVEFFVRFISYTLLHEYFTSKSGVEASYYSVGPFTVRPSV